MAYRLQEKALGKLRARVAEDGYVFEGETYRVLSAIVGRDWRRLVGLALLRLNDQG